MPILFSIMRKLVVIILAFIYICESIVVKTRYGPVLGLSTTKANVFYGIPYASPPKRWKDAVRPTSWNVRGIFNATFPRPQCFQTTCTEPIGCILRLGIRKMSENCLNLNIFTPLDIKSYKKRAVMIWIHGGSFTEGSGAALIYNAEQVVNTGDVIVVAINYRLGAFGFLVAGEGPCAAIGNYGIRDQRLAFKWVKENIHRFGGDRNKITLWGQSAGAQSIAIHLSTRKSKNLFNYAILSSLTGSFVIKSRRSVEKQGRTITELVGCKINDMSCLRNVPAEALIEAQGAAGSGTNDFITFFEPLGPYIDGKDITFTYTDAARRGLFQNKPIIIGTNFDENDGDIYDIFRNRKPLELLIFELRFWWKCGIEASSLPDLLSQFRCPDAEAILNQYPPIDITDIREETSDLTSDFIYTCPTRNISTNLALAGNRNVRVFIFNSSLPIPENVTSQAKCATRACHSANIPFFFNSFDKLLQFGFNPTSVDLKLAREIITYLTNFAKTGNPNGRNLKEWPEFSSNIDGQKYLVWRPSGSVVITNHRRQQCNFWDTLGYDIRTKPTIQPI